ncbi:hypothetical protein OMO38_00555 [Chryseobacterium sp. 09-1422]|uniref:Lipoprotein n=1 Tax=Chryseobacterium kimseyorum TaxID=2984028 RepID=A0ABT3HTA8_9FLAO|nr:hypothetical protein [Chryseobacterium kimseyorum]MCW3167004.1 hypothetical protein [Chryseobacterium kimseyorum]
MKKTVTFLLLLMISVGFGLQSCEKKTEKPIDKSNETNDTVKTTPKISVIKKNDSLLMQTDLNIVTSLNVNKKGEFFENGSPLTKYLALELIDKSLFESKRKTAVNFLVADTTSIQKKNGIIELVCKNKTVKYTDVASDNDGMQIFSYIGQFEFLNKYLIAGSYYEGGDYISIDKITGAETNTFIDFPYVSPDKKNIICVNSNGYESTADVELYEISGTKINHVMSASFKNWMTLAENDEMFWSSDGYLYLKVHNAKTFWKEDGHYNDNYQYIRIKII